MGWPLQISYEIEYSYDPTINSSSVIISKTFLKLEPIGLTLVIFFSTILLIQFGDVQIAHLAQSKKCLDEPDGSITVNLDNYYNRNMENLKAHNDSDIVTAVKMMRRQSVKDFSLHLKNIEETRRQSVMC